MVSDRVRGLCNAVVSALLALNLIFYITWLYVVQVFQWIEFRHDAQPYFYLLAVFVGLFICSSQIYKHEATITRFNFAEALILSIKIGFSYGLATAFLYMTLKDGATSRAFLFSYLILSIPLNYLILRVAPKLSAQYFFPKNKSSKAILVGNGEIPKLLHQYIDECETYGISFYGYFSDDKQDSIYLPRLGKYKEVLNSEHLNSERILSFNNNYNTPGFWDLVHHCQNSGIRLQAYTNFSNLFEDPITLTNDGGLNFITFIKEPLDNPLNKFSKRLIDLFISIPVVLFVIPPLSFIVWVLQRIQSPGPVFFIQKRYGQNRKHFQIYKFRTMGVKDEGDTTQAKKGDPRIYPFGSFLRKTSLDEFPQFINVLKGEMSVVGPRPHYIKHDEDFEKFCRAYRSRHFVKPGITGYAQINGFRGEIHSDALLVKRIKHDVYYINNWSIQLEIYIICKTAWHIIFPPDAAY